MVCVYAMGKYKCLQNSSLDSKFCAYHRFLDDKHLYCALFTGDYTLVQELLPLASSDFNLENKSRILEHIIVIYLQKILSDSQIVNFPKIIQLLINYNTPLPDFNDLEKYNIFPSKSFNVNERVRVIKPIFEKYKKTT
jgi:hypothetical protein